MRYPQCDQGKEFVGPVLDVLTKFKCGPICNSTAYHPQTNGLVERGNGMLKRALDAWFAQERTTDWLTPLSRIVLQLNCNKPRTTRHTPYELKNAMKPTDFDGLDQSEGPLDLARLTAVMDAASLEDSEHTAAAATDSAEPATDAAAGILHSLAAGHTGSAELPNSHERGPQSHERAEDSESDTSDSEVDNPDAETDCSAGTTGSLHAQMERELNVGCRFVRLGGEGAGRCAISAFYNALQPMAWLRRTAKQRRGAYDDIRKKLRRWWERLESATDGADARERAQIQQLQFDLGTNGIGEGDELKDADLDGQRRDAVSGREECWQQLGVDLTVANKSLGSDAIAIMARQHERLNVILWQWHFERSDFGAGTPEAVSKWATATAREKQVQMRSTGRDKPGGKWVEEAGSTSYTLVPAFIVQDRPFIVLYQRTYTHWKARRGRSMETDSGGHFEAVVKRFRNAAGEVQYSGLFSIRGDTALEYNHCLTLAQRYMATINQQAASQNMARDYDRKSNVHQFSQLDAVGVRVPGRNPRKGNTRNILPGLVVGIHSHKVGTANAVTHKLYTVWCPHGVLSQPIKVDKLVTLSANNFPELLEFRDVNSPTRSDCRQTTQTGAHHCSAPPAAWPRSRSTRRGRLRGPRSSIGR